MVYILQQKGDGSMQTVTEQVAVRPFHETIVEAIGRCPSPSNGEILHLFQLIKDTKIPKGHDEIIAAIDKFFDFPGAGKWAREIREVKESVLGQKQASAKKSEGEKKSVNLDELQQEVEKLLALLKDRQPASRHGMSSCTNACRTCTSSPLKASASSGLAHRSKYLGARPSGTCAFSFSQKIL